MTDIVKLQQGQSANSNQCGSCIYFKRLDWGGNYSQGRCTFKLPPQFQLVTRKPNDDSETFIDQVTDTWTCNLYKSANKKYVQEKSWNA